SSAAPRIATWFGPAWRFTASTRPRARKTPCGRWWTSRAGSSRCARSTRATPSVMAQPSPPRGQAASPSSRSAMRMASYAQPAPPGASPQPRSSLPGSGVPSPAACRWTYWRSTSAIFPRAPRAAAVFPLRLARAVPVTTLLPGWGLVVTRFSPISDDAPPGFTRGSDSGAASWALRHAAPRFGLRVAPHPHALNERYPTMARRETSFICQNCGAAYGRWQGKCDACGEWNTISEESSARPQLPGRAPRKGRLVALEPLAGAGRHAPRLASGLAEFDRVTGGGFVRGSVLLLGGDPGIGKSTLLIQVAAALARGGHRAIYISGEEAVAQVRLRAERLGLADAQVELAAETSVEDIVATLSERASPRLVIIDSIQTMWTEMVEA